MSNTVTKQNLHKSGKSPHDDDKIEKKHLDEELDKALKDTFPGSDPPAVIQPPHSKHDKDVV